MIYPASKQYLNLANNAIENGEIIVYPTDTLYGFGVDSTNTRAIQKLNKLKGRVQPLSIIVESVNKIAEYAKLENNIANKLDKIFPGKYTALLLAKKNSLSPLVQNGSSKIGIRIPDHFFPIKLTQILKKPIITTSINHHGKEALNDVTQIEKDFPNIDIYKDEKLKNSKGSTIIDFSISPPQLIRNGDGPYPM